MAIAACDLAEVLGSAIGLQLLFGLPLLLAVFVTALDTFVLLLLHHRGIRLMEAFIVVLVTTIGVCFGDRGVPGAAGVACHRERRDALACRAPGRCTSPSASSAPR